ncbi:nucleoside hydrolase [Amycolatopsis sp. A1MSW2902]|uniref:nucleoside hydrolase n=1 Tax=Amycolatopsis sp. A1MSW2902 TaxID=687413 RepID=UPI00307DD24A
MTTPPRPVLVDTDGGLDDALALHYLARCPDIRLLAVGTVHGNVTAAAAARNALRALELAGDHSTPVAIGSAEPLAQALQLRHPDDPFAALAGKPGRGPSDQGAVEQMLDLARACPGEVELLALGPMTNLARALAAEPDLPRLLRRVVAMAGAFDTTGNITPHAETNVRLDPDAADQVLAAGFAITLVSLDVTRTVAAGRGWLQQLADGAVPLWGPAAAMLLQARDQVPSLPLHDPLAAAVLVDEHLALERRTAPVAVVLDDRHGHRGATRIATDDPGRPAVAITSAVDPDAVLARLAAGLTA